MADKRITDLEELSGQNLNANDILMVVTSDVVVNKKIKVGSLINNMPSYLGLKEYDDVNTMNTSCSLSTGISHITGGTSQFNISLPDGTQGQLKILTMIDESGYSVILDSSNISAANTIEFNNVGDSITLLFTNSNWVIISSYGINIV